MRHPLPVPHSDSRDAEALAALTPSDEGDFLTRGGLLYAWREARLRTRTWAWARSLDTPIGPRITLRDEAGIATHGLNFVTQDPLSLASHPAVYEAVREALRHGLHAPGSHCFAGSTAASVRLETMLADLFALEHVLLFSSGWAAAYGALTALVRPEDHVVLDTCVHPSLRAGATTATANVHYHAHGDRSALASRLAAIRDSDARAALLVVTETLFPWESDSPDLRAIQDLCRAHGAALLVAVGYDLGVTGPGGLGILGAQQMLGQVDFIVGSFAKTLATNGGFFATRSAGAKQLVRFFASSHASSNGLAPLQAAIAQEGLRIVTSQEGAELRANLACAVTALREACAARLLHCLGSNAALVPIAIGSEGEARLTEALASERGVLCSVVEEPFVPRGTARLALHVMAAHRSDHAIEAAEKIAAARTEARARLALA